MITCHNLKRRFEDVKDDYFTSLKTISENEKVVNGPYVQDVEKKLQELSGRKHCILVRSGSHAISLSLLAHGIKPGDEVIVPNYSCHATLSSVAITGAIPNFCEINKYGMLDHFLLSANDKTKAILATGLYGDIYQHNEIKKFCKNKNLIYVNDAAQSIFAKFQGIESTSLGDIVCLSFAENKPIPTLGTFGAKLTDNTEIYYKLLHLRKNGKPFRRAPYTMPGVSSHPEEDKAAQILASMKHTERWQKRRHKIAEYYDKYFQEKGIVTRPRPNYSEWNTHKYAIMCKNKFEMYEKLQKDGIDSECHYTDNFAKLPWTPNTEKQFTITDYFIQRSLSIPINAYMTDSEVNEVAEKVYKNYQK